jgi:hypothetical protein
MQLSRPRARLAALSCVVMLSTIVARPSVAQDRFRLSADTLFYGDDNGVLVVTPQTSVAYALDESGGEVWARGAVDVVSAASVDVVAQATRGFSEARVEAGLGISKAFGAHLPSLSYRVSVEPDYVSHGGHAGWQTELGSSDSILAVGYGLTFDTIGRHGTDFDAFSASLLTHAADVSFTQVLGERWLARLAYVLTVQEGYLEKPYRYVPLFLAGTLSRQSPTLATFDALRLEARPPENVPDERIRHALALRVVGYLEPLGAALHLDWQLYGDSWRVFATAVQPALHFELSDTVRLVALARFYHQSDASFWRREYVVSSLDVVPTWRSVDRDLSSYTTFSGGLRVEWDVTEGLELYAEARPIYTAYHRFMFLDHMTSFVGQGGVRWTP